LTSTEPHHNCTIMIFQPWALLAAILVAGSSAFVPRPVGRSLVLFPSAGPSDVVSRSVHRSRCLAKSSALRMVSDDDDDDDDEDYEEDDNVEDPLGNGVDSVSWLPTVVGASAPTEAMMTVGSEADVLPLFPLGGIVYTPNSEHILNIFEPRYREMYNDILMNGSKRFVVSMSHPSEEGRFAQMGVLFQLEDLKEVSEQTGDQIKYVCNHKVVGRVKLNRVLNPEVWSSRDTYLRAEGEIIDDTSDLDEDDDDSESGGKAVDDVYTALANAAGSSLSKEEKALRDSFTNLVEMQHELEEDVRFTRSSAATLAVGPEATGDGSLWTTIRLWQSYTEQRLVARQNEMQREFQDKLLEFLMKEKGVKEEEIPSAIGFTDLSPELQKEVTELQKRMSLELRPLVLESTLTMQKILEAGDHEARVNLLRHFIEAERRRLEAKKTLKGMFSGGGGGIIEKVGEAEAIEPSAKSTSSTDASKSSISGSFGSTDGGADDSEGDDADSDSSKSGSIYLDDDDAFQ